jgi:hypothetical protein
MVVRRTSIALGLGSVTDLIITVLVALAIVAISVGAMYLMYVLGKGIVWQ